MDPISISISSARLALSGLLHWLKGVRIHSTVTLGAAIKKSHGPFQVGRIILIKPSKFNGQFPIGLNLANCDPVFVVEVKNKGGMATTLKNVGIDNKRWCLTNTFHSGVTLPHRLVEKSGEIWVADFSHASFISFETGTADARPKKIGALLEFADGTKRRSKNRLRPALLSDFAAAWNQALEVGA